MEPTAQADPQPQPLEFSKAFSSDRWLQHLKMELSRNGVNVNGMDSDAITRRHDELLAERERQHQDRQLHAEQARSQADAARLYKSSGVPERHKEHLRIIDADRASWAPVFAKLHARDKGYLVALLGTRGTGKTQLAVALIHAACQRGQSARYVKAIDLFRTIRRAYGPEPTASEDRIIDGLAGVDLLVVDELHQRGQSEWEAHTLTNLIDRRYDAMKSTLLVANLSKADFAQQIGDSVVSRIHETGAAIELTGQSYRRPGQWEAAI